MDNTTNAGGSHGFDRGPRTQGFPAQPPPGPPGAAPRPDLGFAPPAPPPRRRRRGPAIVVGALVAVIAIAAGFVVGWVVNDDSDGADGLPVPLAAQNGTAAGDAGDSLAGAGNPAAGGGGPFDLRRGAVFVQTNDPTANEVIAFSRSEDGRVHEVGRYKTGGVGSGSFEDSAHGIVLGTTAGETSPQHNLDSAQLLYVANAGSDSISVFRVAADGLQLVSNVPSGGTKPVSLTVNHGLLYALNSGELDDRFVLRFPDQFLDNCTHGDQPSVSGFRIDVEGRLTPIPSSTRPLSGGGRSGCAQVSFTPDGSQLVVSERVATLPTQPAENGAIDTFAVNPDGTLGAKSVQNTSGAGPFGFAFTKDGTVLFSEQNHTDKGKGTASSYTMLGNGTLKAISKAVPNSGTDTCWIVPTNDGKLAFTSNALGGGSLSSYRVEDTGALTLLHPQATDKGPKDGTLDIALSHDSRWLYQLNSHFGLLQVFQVNADGTLKFLEEHKAFDVVLPENGGQLPPFGIAAY
ncbi:lactonase family protein [Amycolatopsis sp. NPDC004772]